MTKQMEITAAALRHNRMETFCCRKKEDIWPIVSQLMPVGSRVAAGGSVSLEQAGVLDNIRQGNYEFLDRNRPGLSAQERAEMMKQALTADVYLLSANAVTQDGILLNADGNGNRLAALVYGPERIIVVAGSNKIVPDVEAGFHRLRTVAAPLNCRRLKLNTYCAKTGHCVALDNGKPAPGSGCVGERICCQYVISAYQRHPDRVKVVLCEEALGY